MAIPGEVEESVGSRGYSRSGPARIQGCVACMVDSRRRCRQAVTSVTEWFAVWPVRGRTVSPRASAVGDAE